MPTNTFTQAQREHILRQAKHWFREVIAQNHAANTRKLTAPSKLQINPFTAVYLANFLTGNAQAESIAKALLLPRVLGTSISTSFGQNMQSFISMIKDAVGSTASGMDIEFIDQLDGHKKYCQLKAGPNTINRDDIKTIVDHFKGVRNLARTNNLRIPNDDMIVGVLYGTPDELSNHYRRIYTEFDHPVFIGQAFWYRLTGDEHFYLDLANSIGEVALEANFSDELEQIIQSLAASDTIQALSNHE